MLISHSRKFIFIHNQKTAGTTIEAILQEQVPDLTTLGLRHNFAVDGVDIIDNWDSYFKFIFIRNPWDRLVSWFSMHEEARKVTWFASKSDERARVLYNYRKTLWFWKFVQKHGKTFDDYVFKCSGYIGSGLPDGLSPISFNQLDYMTDKQGNLLVDSIGRFENFQEDFREIGGRIGLDLAKIPVINYTKHKHYSEYYTPATRDAVAEMYRRDIEYFNFKFESPKE
jgi:hypothetical protein